MQINEWIKFQENNASKILSHDHFDINIIKYVGGLDISFDKIHNNLACGYIGSV
jgi:hypothetical protein